MLHQTADNDFGDRCRSDALSALAAGDWHGVYVATKGWVGSGGGAWLPDTWILYAVSALLKGEPRTAVHSLDLGLGTWIPGPRDRAALRWLRGVVVWTRLNDPRTALLDLDTTEDLPAWLAADRTDAVDRCTAAATTSRKRVPSVRPSPPLAPAPSVHATVAPPTGRRDDGDEPSIWSSVVRTFDTR